MSTVQNDNAYPLPHAALLLQQSWEVTWRMVLNGVLPGEKRGGRWFVAREAVDRLVRERSGQAATPTPSA